MPMPSRMPHEVSSDEVGLPCPFQTIIIGFLDFFTSHPFALKFMLARQNMIPSQEWNVQRSDRSSPEEEEEEVTKWTDAEVSTNLSSKVSSKVSSWTDSEVSTKTKEIEEEIVDY